MHLLSNQIVNDVCQKIEASVLRVASIVDLTCINENGKFILRGRAPSREEAVLAVVAARLVPGVDTVSSELKVVRAT